MLTRQGWAPCAFAQPDLVRDAVVLQEHGLAYLAKQRKFLQDEAYRRSKYAGVPSKDWLAKTGKKDYEVSD